MTIHGNFKWNGDLQVNAALTVDSNAYINGGVYIQSLASPLTVHGNLGVALMAKNDCVGAMHHFAEAIRIQPDSANAHTALGISMIDCGKIEEAVILFRKILKKWP